MKNMHYDCLIVDDEEALSQSASEYFNIFEVRTAWVANAEACMRFFQEHTADLILLDVNLGGASGFDLCKQLREQTRVPILFISARRADEDMLMGLSVGGDDYIRKPCSLPVLLAKVKVVLARYRSMPAAPEGSSALEAVPDVSSVAAQGGLFASDSGCAQWIAGADQSTKPTLKLNEGSRSFTLNGKKTELKLMEFKLLSYLVRNQGRVIGKEELFRNVWEDPVAGENTLNVHVRRLREKLEEDPNDPRFIRTVWGSGYVYEDA